MGRSALTISIVSVAIAVTSAAFSFFQYANTRDQLLVNSRPYLVVERRLQLVSPNMATDNMGRRLNLIAPSDIREITAEEILYRVKNIGAGRAILRWVGAGFGGTQAERYTQQILSECAKDEKCKSVPIGYYVGLDEDQGVAPGASFTLFYLQLRTKDFKAAALFSSKFEELQHKIVYCSTYGECFQICKGFVVGSGPDIARECRDEQVTTVGLFERLNPVFQYNWTEKTK
jgi:hypothetical protein